MKALLCICLAMLSLPAMAQDNPFLAVAYIGSTQHDLFLGAAPAKHQFVSTQVDAFEAVPSTPEPVKPVTVQKPVQSPTQAPVAPMVKYVYVSTQPEYRAVERRGWFGRRSERRSARVGFLGWIRSGGC